MTSNGLVPLIRYRDVAAAVDWLSSAFNFEKRSVVTDPDGTVAYAELSYGRGIVMLGPVGESVLDSLMKQPDEVGGVGTQSVYVAVDNVEAHFKHARNAGADIVLEFGSDEAGDRAYAARDSEGHVWNFGAYSPWPAAALPPLGAAAEPAAANRPTRGQAVLGGAVAALAIASVAGLAQLGPQKPSPRFMAAPAVQVTPDYETETAALKETLAREAHARQEAARSTAAIREELAREREQRLAAEAAHQALQKQLAETQSPPANTTTASAPAGTLPVTTGSLGAQTHQPALAPTDAEPAPPVTIAPATPTQAPASAAVAPPAKPKAAKPRLQAQKKKSPPKKSDDPLFLYD